MSAPEQERRTWGPHLAWPHMSRKELIAELERVTHEAAPEQEQERRIEGFVVVDSHGVVSPVLYDERRDAEQRAARYDQSDRRTAPHRVVRLVEQPDAEESDLRVAVPPQQKQEPPASALDRVLLALWSADWTAFFEMGLRPTVILAAQKELDRLRADLADVARLEAWLQENRDHSVWWAWNSWNTCAFTADDPDDGNVTAPSVAALGAAVATEGKA